MSRKYDGTKVIETKVVVLGTTGVGKTSLVNKYVRGQFPEHTTSTIGAVYMKKDVMVNNKTKVVLQIWDTAGQERFRSMAPMYYRGAHAAVLVFDVTDEKTLVKVEGWVDELQAHACDDLVLALAANKCDIKHKDSPAILADAQEYAKRIDAKLFETSAKKGTGIEELYTHVARALAEIEHKKQTKREEEEKSRALKLGGASAEPQGGCC